MALPVAPPPKPKDIVVLDWAGLTVRIAWTLIRLKVNLSSEVLNEARIHTFFHLDRGIVPTTAQDLAEHLTEEFVARARGNTPDDPWSQDWDMPLSPRWRRAVDEALDQAADLVFRKHYGDHKRLEALATDVDIEALQSAQSRLREVVRRIAVADGFPMEDWAAPRIDRLLRRLAAWSPGPCPATHDLTQGFHRAHVAHCPRCERLVRLVKSRLLASEELSPPSVGARPTKTVQVIAIQIHPEGRRFRGALTEELGVPVYPAGQDLVLINAVHLDTVGSVLRMAAEVGSPPRHMVRGALLEGPGMSCPRAILGPLPERAAHEVLNRSWGTVEGIGELPPELPEPPSAAGAWGAAVGVAIVAIVAAFAVNGPAPAADPPWLQAEFVEGRGGLWATFDVPDEAWVTIVALPPQGGLRVVFESTSAADKAELAVGDGRYRLHTTGTGLMLASHPGPLPNLEAIVADLAVGGDPVPFDVLASSLGPTVHTAWTVR